MNYYDSRRNINFLILKNRDKNPQQVFKVYFTFFIVSEIRFIVWTDASTRINEGIEETSIGYVIKDSKLPPLCGSRVYSGIGNSKGELKAGVESLGTLVNYCKCNAGIDTKNCVVELRTDFPELKDAVDKGKIKGSDFRKKKIFHELKDLKKLFKAVECKEIYRSYNIAHNVCYYKIFDRQNGTVKKFFELYENPEDYKIKLGHD